LQREIFQNQNLILPHQIVEEMIMIEIDMIVGEIGIVIEDQEVVVAEEDFEVVQVITEEEEGREGLTDINPVALYPY
jgi:hypothetical protein